MVVLALETATRGGSVAVWIDGASHTTPGDPARTHGERLPAEVLTSLARAGRRLEDVDVFAIVSGPGSFTGLRVGMAAMQGLAITTRRRVVAIPTLDALASGWLDQHGAAPGTILALCLDGQRGDVFYGALEAGSTPRFEDARPLLEPSVGTPAEAASAFRGLASRRDAVVLGNGVQRYRDAFASALPGVPLDEPTEPLAGAAARLAARQPERAVAPHALRPIYVRRPDAELARDRARARPAPGLPAGWSIGRASGADDLTVIEALQRRAFTNAWGAEALRWELENTDVARLYVLRDATGAAIAYCACWMVFDELHINSLAVDEPFRRRGLARELLRVVIQDAVANGARAATLEVRQSNRAARALYERLGFGVEGVRRDYYQDPREDALVLWNRRL